jgi:hypothetical protein
MLTLILEASFDVFAFFFLDRVQQFLINGCTGFPELSCLMLKFGDVADVLKGTLNNSVIYLSEKIVSQLV